MGYLTRQGIVSVRTASILVTSLLVDSEIVSAGDAHLLLIKVKSAGKERINGENARKDSKLKH